MTRSKLSQEERRNEHLIRLLPRIKAKATHLVFTYRPELDPADVVQESASAFLERAKADPTFMDKDDDAIVRRVTFDGWNAVRRFHHWDSEVGLQPVTIQGQPLDSPFAADAPNPEEAVIAADLSMRVQEAIANLKLTTRGSKDTYLFIIRGLMEGLKPCKVMERLGIRKQNWSYYRKRLQHAFMAVGYSY